MSTEGEQVTSGTMELTLHPRARLVVLRFAGETNLTGEQAATLTGALETVRAGRDDTFGLLADAAGVHKVGADYRALTGTFFGKHRATIRIALVNLGPVVRIVAEMLRVGIGLHLRTFADDAAARAWLRAQGVDV